MSLIKKLRLSFSQVAYEMGRVVWPSRRDVLSTLALVLIIGAIMAVFLLVVDASVVRLMSYILGVAHD